ncbi:FtsK/SpoIIIE domain-containing protein [Barnesiella sp. ET7]|uniref:FtsK/SpoIIIE domain-containing protein n=1 Tax=Barnesiella sp. ET7 TaxID=2972460 RepID=UPI0021ABCB44|nr:FtsK/SpoIIIE domain-containing protein [Barnesiella sp. ET7]MCR8912895.1 FtsK/SpoIIIE domain-containing protein [Barnesiella sp. ET7]
MNTHYFVELDGQQFGPYELEQMKTFGLMPNVQVYSTLSEEWAPVESYPELVDFIAHDDNSNDDVDIYNATYYLRLGEDNYGPYSLPELSFLDIEPNSLLSIDNMNSWLQASEIKGLLSAIDLLAEEDNKADTPIVETPNTDELEEIIEEQEAEIVQLKDQLSRLQNKLDDAIDVEPDTPVYDMAIDSVPKYGELCNELCVLIQNTIQAADGQKIIYQKVFPTIELEKQYYIEEYSKFINSLKQVLGIVTEKALRIQSSFENDIMLLDNSAQATHRKCIKESNEEERALIETINQQIESIKNSKNVDIAIASLKATLSTRRAEIIAKYKKIQAEELEKIAVKKREVKQAYESLQRDILVAIKNAYSSGQSYYEAYFNHLYETSKADMSLWDSIDDKGTMPSSLVMVGKKEHRFAILGENITISENCYVELLNNQNLIIRHNNNTKQKAHQVVNSLVGRLMASSSPGKLNVAMIDAEEMDGTCDVFKFLNRNIFQILARPEDIRKYLDEKERHIGNIIQNLLLGSVKSLYDYNQAKENKEPYHVIVIEDFPIGFNSESLSLLQKILKNGVRAGVNVIMLVNEDKIDSSEDTRKAYNSSNMGQLERICSVYDLTKNNEQIDFDSFTEEHLRKIVQYVNSGVEIRKEEAILFADYMTNQSEWWQRRSAKYIEIPFGMSEDRQIQKLKITQESGQNSAVVIGIPGSGKSVFLHALICNAAINYSPDELNMYLIDFSGVEFNSYALHNLPHARVIAPEAEREFGLSILNELVEEGARRMELCRNNDVSNIVDLKAKNPSLHIPRLLVIIDEFQKIFEIENDLISREANAKIHTIIQEFRKFGINLVLATQKLPSSSILPKDLIANRVVFKSSPADFSSLISLPINGKVPQLHTGECIYNSESGSPYDNHKVQGFLVTKHDIDKLLNQISEFSDNLHYKRKHDMVVFRGNDLPEFRNRRVARCHQTPSNMPESIGIYLGESISIHETDVCAILRKESANNILILGGESHVAQRIAYYATISASTAHTDQSATFVTLNFMRREDTLNEELQSVFESLPFSSQIVSKTAEIVETLTAIKEEIDERRKDEERPQDHIYLSIYAFQLARMFDKGGRRGDDVSESGMLLDYILKNGPAVGVFTIMQCDNWDNLSRIGNPLSSFTYRVALQMTENDSNKIVGSSIASKLFVFNRPSSVYRAYFRDNNRNINIKFKPYK